MYNEWHLLLNIFSFQKPQTLQNLAQPEIHPPSTALSFYAKNTSLFLSI